MIRKPNDDADTLCFDSFRGHSAVRDPAVPRRVGVAGDESDVVEGGPKPPFAQLLLCVVATSESCDCGRVARAGVFKMLGLFNCLMKCGWERSAFFRVWQLAVLRSVSRAYKPFVEKGDEVRRFVRSFKQSSQ